MNNLAKNFRSWQSYCYSRYISMSNVRKDKQKFKSKPPEKLERDWVGPPEKDSNMRQIQFHIPDSETALQKKFRMLRQDTLDFNNKFWTKHNDDFFREKELFVKTKLAEKKVESDITDKDVPSKLTPEEMSMFYRQFLNENFRKNVKYNGEWYKRNFSLFALLLRVFLERMKFELLNKVKK